VVNTAPATGAAAFVAEFIQRAQGAQTDNGDGFEAASKRLE
jgi:hypothetical protein